MLLNFRPANFNVGDCSPRRYRRASERPTVSTEDKSKTLGEGTAVKNAEGGEGGIGEQAPRNVVGNGWKKNGIKNPPRAEAVAVERARGSLVKGREVCTLGFPNMSKLPIHLLCCIGSNSGLERKFSNVRVTRFEGSKRQKKSSAYVITLEINEAKKQGG